MSNEIHNPPVDYTDLSLRVQEQIRRKFLPLCTEDEKQQVQTTLMPMVQFASSTVSTPSRHVLVTAKIPDQCQLLRWAVACFIYGMDKIEAAKKNGEYVKANREQLARFQLGRGPCIPLPKPPLRSIMTGLKRRASQTQPGDADDDDDDDDDGQRRVKFKTSLSQSDMLDSEIKRKVREAANESRRMELKNANGNREEDLINREAALMQREADLEKKEIELTCLTSDVESREVALEIREASAVQREADFERTLSTSQTPSDSRSVDLGHSESAMNHRLEALKTKETELNNRVVFLDMRKTELDNLEATMDTRATELNNREVVLKTRNTELNNLEAAMDTRATEMNNREVVLKTRNTELNNLEAAIDARNTELNNREAAMDIRDVQLENRDTVLGSYEIDLGHCEVVTNSLPADLASCETALDSYETGQDDGEARLRNQETDLDNLEANLDSKEAQPTKQESDADDCMPTSGFRASQPDSATPPAQTAPRFDDKYIEEYRKCYNRAILDIMYLRSLGDTERRMVQDEQFRDALMEEIKKTTGSLTDATDSAWKIFGYLARS
ncbi:hypothetical protein ACQRIU_004792 [Beauveria bassiana]